MGGGKRLLRSDDRHGKSYRLQFRVSAFPVAQWAVGSTGVHAVAGKDGNGDEAADEANVKQYGQESEEGDPAQEAGQDDGEAGVDDRTAGYALAGFHPCWDVLVVLGQVGQKPGEHAEDDGCAEEFERSEEGVKALQGETALGRHLVRR